MTLVNRAAAASRQSASSACATAEPVSLDVPAHEVAQQVDVLGVERLEVDHLAVDPRRRRRSRTYAVPPDMPAAKLRPVAAEHDDRAAGHVLAAVVADALDDGGRAGVADREPLPHQAADEHLAAGRAVEQRRCRR